MSQIEPNPEKYRMTQVEALSELVASQREQIEYLKRENADLVARMMDMQKTMLMQAKKEGKQ